MTRDLLELLAAIGVPPRTDWEKAEITGVCDDSRMAQPGSLFVAIPGFVADGHRYIRDAVFRGAVAVVGEKEFDSPVPYVRVPDARAALAWLSAEYFFHPTRDLLTVGVTGTNGKTTICHLIAHLLGEADSEVVGTVTNEDRGLHAVTTPESHIIQQIANNARESGKRCLVVETSSAGLALHRVDGVDFDAAVFTNLTHDHFEFHATWEAYLEAKLILFKGLKESAAAVINRDDPVADRVIAETTGRPFTYGIAGPADFRATKIEYALKETRFVIEHDNEHAHAAISLPGEHNVYNALAAAAVATSAGMSLTQIAASLATASSVDGRYQFHTAKNGATVIVDFAHSPDSLQRMLVSLRPYYQRIICVFGCGGESDRDKRPIMGRISGELADVTILTSDNPKTENPEEIIDAIAQGLIPTGGRYERIVDRRSSIDRAVELSRPGDVVLLAGKGHEPYQIVGHEYIPYNDARYLVSAGLVKR
jgi:UDP-N-acetylmuramoyl-L-alanyl-D-glutamate--2,6-diaminopimelate ligase